MAGTDVRVTLDNAAIARAVFPGGMIGNRMEFIGTSIETLGRIEAPARTGELRASISAGRVHANGVSATVRVSADSPHARYVLRGTIGPIHASLRRTARGQFAEAGRDSRGRKLRQRKRMPVGRSQGATTAFALAVSGQDANDFLTRAARAVVARHTR
jgi:hypothetical protein